MTRAFEQAFINELTVNKIFGPGAPINFKTGGKSLIVDSHQRFPGAYPTLTGALAACTSGQGDLIEIVPYHAETLTSAITVTKAGVIVIGHGNGNARPTFTVNAAIYGLDIQAINTLFYNIKLVSGASSTIATKLFRCTGGYGLVTFRNCHFQVGAATKMYHLGYILGAKGLPVNFEDCVFENLSTLAIAAAATVQHTAVLIRNGDVNVVGCRFIDMGAQKKNRWARCIMAGSRGTGEDLGNIEIKDTVFTCRGVAVTARAAAVSPRISIIDSKGISTSANTAVANIFQVTYANIVNSFAMGAVNVRAKMVPAATEA